MDPNPLSKYTVSFGLSLALCSVVNALLVVVKEKSPAVQAEMQRMTGHHWVTHSTIVVGLFLLCGWLFTLPNGGRGLRLPASRLMGIMVAGVVLSGAIIMGFYLFAD
jgi:putative flippase GtrA